MEDVHPSGSVFRECEARPQKSQQVMEGATHKMHGRYKDVCCEYTSRESSKRRKTLAE